MSNILQLTLYILIFKAFLLKILFFMRIFSIVQMEAGMTDSLVFNIFLCVRNLSVSRGESVPHKRLLLKLQRHGIDRSLLLWFRNFPTNRMQCVVISGVTPISYPESSGSLTSGWSPGDQPLAKEPEVRDWCAPSTRKRIGKHKKNAESFYH